MRTRDEHTGYDALHHFGASGKPHNKYALREWLAKSTPQLQFSVTLTLKQHMEVAGSNGYKTYVKLDEQQAEGAARRFLLKLDREVLGSAARRFGRSLFYLPVLEGCKQGQRLHLHIGVGAVPEHMYGPRFFKAVGWAARCTDWVDAQIDVLVADRYLSTYNTKTVSKYDTDAVLWNLVPLASAYCANR